jgi:hypothetical protein
MLVSRILKTMESLGYKIFTEPGELNIVYVEGINPDGTVNDDKMNQWNDLRLVIQADKNLQGKILGSWAATTEPGWKYTNKPLNPQGAFRIAFGQYKAWVVGIHNNHHEALVQLWKPGEKLENGLRVGEIRGFRDRNKDGFRTGDPVVVATGIGINQHHGYNMKFVNGASAGCLVGRFEISHEKFMKIVKTDVRFKNNPNYIYWSTILDGSKLIS